MISSKLKKNFDKLKINGWDFYLNKSFPRINLKEFPHAGNFNGVRGPFEKIEASKYTRVYKCAVAFKGRIRDFYFKQYLCRSVTDFLKHIFRPSRARRSLNASEILYHNDLHTPEVIAVGDKKLGPFPINNFMITREIKNARTLYEYIKMDWQSLGNRRLFFSKLGTEIGKMHAAGISHGDLRPGNILVTFEDNDYTFYFLDNERTRKFRHIPDRLRFKNLVQINMFHRQMLNLTDRMRFYKNYLKQNPDLKSPKETAGRIARKTTQRLANK